MPADIGSWTFLTLPFCRALTNFISSAQAHVLSCYFQGSGEMAAFICNSLMLLNDLVINERRL